jgi:GTP 3',8-cyclase
MADRAKVVTPGRLGASIIAIEFPTLAAWANCGGAGEGSEGDGQWMPRYPRVQGGNARASRVWKGNARWIVPACVFFPLNYCSRWSFRRWSLARCWRDDHGWDAQRQRLATSDLLLTDKFGRSIHDLRISITDRCNYRCVYCRTGTNGAAYAELPFADYLRMARILISLGITKIRLTGGEPLLRKGIVDFIRDLSKLRTVRGEKPEIALTTNGHLLAEIAQSLKDAGLDRVTVSMDAVDPDRFARITRVPNGYDRVLAGVRASRRVGLDPVKINCVLLRGFNEDQIIPFGMFAREEGVMVRFIEFMPLEEDRVWTPETVIALDEIVARMSEYLPLVEIAHERSETARRYRFPDGVGEIGIIAPVSHPFCGHCSRIRITSDGKLRTCLFSVWDHDLHELMRRGASDEKLVEFIVNVVEKKEERHHIGEPGFVPASRTMVHIGG